MAKLLHDIPTPKGGDSRSHDLTGSVCRELKPQPAIVSWPKYLRRCENCRGLMWRLNSGKWTHCKSEWRNETQNRENSHREPSETVD